MMESRFDTITVPQILTQATGPGDISGPFLNTIAPSCLAQAGSKTPLRVVVRNVSENGDYITLAYDDAATLQKFPVGSNVYFLPAGASDVFVLAPQQRLFVSSATVDCRASVAISEALPADIKTP